MSGRKMHQTTVRFGPDLWDEIEVEARRAGVSVAQYVRDSALMRVAYTRGRDGDPHYDAALVAVAGAGEARPAGSGNAVEDALDRAGENLDNTAALHAQRAQAQRHARDVRDASLRGRRAPEPGPPAND